MAGQQGEEQLERDADINRLDRTHHVAGAIGFQDPRTLAPRRIVPTMPPPDCLVPYIHEAGFGGPLQMRPFDYDMPLVSALVERRRLETHSFHMPWGVHDHLAGTADEAYHLGPRTDGDPTSGCVRDIRVWYGTDTWEMAEQCLGGHPPAGRGRIMLGEYDLAEAVSADDSGVRGSAGCAATVCPMLHHDDDRGRLVPRQDQQHRVAAVGPVAVRL
ncbi:hypothetical protein PIB30_091197 [Stylosanthes scabra]|uniref:Aminotransferase-like plant mobile domain-containing protein n=1 Tax=Stylosanthes scabra TaxID=79078 RepID=A0ABU6YTB4_9FABA|nr:hypothetical protein [Stylosanthes scabra]